MKSKSPADKAILDKITYIRRRGIFQQFEIPPKERELEGFIKLNRAILDAGLVDALEDLLQNYYEDQDAFYARSPEFNWFRQGHPETGQDIEILSERSALDTEFVEAVAWAFFKPLVERKLGVEGKLSGA